MAPPELEAFVRDAAPRLLRRARLLTRDPYLAEDLTQETLTKVVVGWRRISRTDDPVTYVNRTLVNTFISWSRRRSFHEVPHEVADLDAAGDSPDADTLDLARALADLPPEHRAALVLRYHDDLSVADVAAALGRSDDWVRQVCHRATRRLRSSSHLAPASTAPSP